MSSFKSSGNFSFGSVPKFTTPGKPFGLPGNIKLPNINAGGSKLPSIRLPDIKAGGSKLPSIKLPDFHLGHRDVSDFRPGSGSKGSPGSGKSSGGNVSPQSPKPGAGSKSGDGFQAGGRRWNEAPTTAAVLAGNGVLSEGMEGAAVAELQRLLGLEADGKFGPATRAAVDAYQRSAGLRPPAGMEGMVGRTTLQALRARGTGLDLGNGLRINTQDPNLQRLATSSLSNGRDYTCVRTTLDNMQRLGVPNIPGGTAADPNNSRGAMVQLLRSNNWESLPVSGSQQRTIRSAYGTVQASVIPAARYRQMVQAGQVPNGAVVFQTRHGWDYGGGARGNDMGIARNGGRTIHNYRSMNGIVYRDLREVVVLVPRGSVQRN